MNYLPALVAGVASFLVGWLWHSPLLFINQWMKLSGITKPEIVTPEMKKQMMRSMLLGLIANLVAAGVLSCIVTQIGKTDMVSTLSVAFWIWLGFVVTTLANGPLWEGKSVKLFLFNATYHLVVVAVMAVALALML